MRRGFVSSCQSQNGFTLAEMVLTVFILGLILSVSLPAVNGVRDENLRMECLGNLRQLQSAKDAYALDHLGEGSPSTEDRRAVFRSYFVEGFQDQTVCPLTGDTYSDIFDVYVRSTCPVCGTDELGTAPEEEQEEEPD